MAGAAFYSVLKKRKQVNGDGSLAVSFLSERVFAAAVLFSVDEAYNSRAP